jgi:hypothetical protein
MSLSAFHVQLHTGLVIKHRVNEVLFPFCVVWWVSDVVDGLHSNRFVEHRLVVGKLIERGLAVVFT